MSKVIYELICDKGREAPIQYINKDNGYCNIILKQLQVGDYAIVKNGKIQVIIERKTWCDLADTIKNPKRKENHKKLLNLRKQTGCSIIYFIEGSAFPSYSRSFNHVPYNCLEGFLDHIVIRDNCGIIYTKDEKHTAERLLSLVKHCMTIKLDENNKLDKTEELNENYNIEQENNNIENDDTENNDTKNNDIEQENDDIENDDIENDDIENDTIEQETNYNLLTTITAPSAESIIQSIWLSICGITIVNLPMFKNYTLHDLFTKIAEQDIANFKYSNGKKVGLRRARLILSCRNNKRIHCKMISCIKGITKKSASIILDNFDILDILSIEYMTDTTKFQTDLANIVKDKSYISEDASIDNSSFNTELKSNLVIKLLGVTIAKRLIDTFKNTKLVF